MSAVRVTPRYTNMQGDGQAPGQEHTQIEEKSAIGAIYTTLCENKSMVVIVLLLLIVLFLLVYIAANEPSQPKPAPAQGSATGPPQDQKPTSPPAAQPQTDLRGLLARAKAAVPAPGQESVKSDEQVTQLLSAERGGEDTAAT